MNDKRLEENRYDSRALNYSNTKEFNSYDNEKLR